MRQSGAQPGGNRELCRWSPEPHILWDPRGSPSLCWAAGPPEAGGGTMAELADAECAEHVSCLSPSTLPMLEASGVPRGSRLLGCLLAGAAPGLEGRETFWSAEQVFPSTFCVDDDDEGGRMKGRLISLPGEREVGRKGGGRRAWISAFSVSRAPGKGFSAHPHRAGSGERELKPPKAGKTCCFPAACSEKAAWGSQNAQQWDCC